MYLTPRYVVQFHGHQPSKCLPGTTLYWNNVGPANVKLFMDNHLDAYLMGVKYQVTVPHMT